MNEGASVSELRNLLQARDQEIQALKYELDKYKLALQQSQLNYHLVQQQLERHKRDIVASTNARAVAAVNNDDSGVMQDEQQTNDDILIVSTSSRRSSASSKPLESTPKRAPSRCSKVLFKTGDDSDDGQSDLEISAIATTSSNNDTPNNGNTTLTMSKSEENLEDIIHDVGEIDLELELSKIAGGSSRKTSSAGPRVMDGNEPLNQINEDNNNGEDVVGLDNEDDGDDDGDGDGDDEDIISDELLTSLTDAAINNLSQLAALQEQCESQQQHSQQTTKYQAPSGGVGATTGANNNNNKSSSNHPHHAQMSRQQSSQSSSFSASASGGGCGEQSTSAAVTPLSPQNVANPMRLMEHRQSKTIDFTQDPFSSVSISNQAAIAISAAAAAAAAAASTTSSPIMSSGSNCQQPHSATKTTILQPNSSSTTSSVSPNSSSTIQSDLTSTSHSLASVVAAAAVAAAAANDQHRQQQHSSLLNHPNAASGVNHPQARLVSSALSHTQDYYHQHQQHPHHLHHQQQQHHHHHQQQQQQHQLHQQYQQHGSPIPSALSTLHFSPSASITPSPCSLLGGTAGGGSTSQSTRRSTPSNASSSIVSPTTLPTYLRRQFLPSADRLPSMSPSPSSGLATGGTSSAASGSLAHILQSHHQHQQQRSVSALAGTISSPTGTPLSGTGSSAVSPLLYSKSPSQARLNNMQIRHKFGYLGSGKAQFNSPHGFCLGLNQEIVVADTNNHRVCIFDKSGTYITQFGSPGKEEGQLWNPRKVAILHRPVRGAAASAGGTGDQQRAKSSYSGAATSAAAAGSDLSHSEPLYVVCDRGAERSRMQLFTKDGAFIKKIGIHYIDIVAGLAITQNGLIIVVDSVSPTVYIINGETGILNGWFDCSGYMKEPSDIAVKSDLPGNEYFICDFKGHCVVVFSEQGEYLRKIGHDGLTSYPNGIDISDDGDILVGDSHGNRFHVVVFDRYGNFVSQFECPHVKVSRCCGLKITREGYIVTLAKNNHHVLVLDTIHI